MDNVTSSKMVKSVLGSILLFLLCVSFFCPTSVLAAPVANAGDDQEVVSGQTVNLDATGSTGDNLDYYWNQTNGPYVDLGDQAFIEQPSFIAPEVQAETEITFILQVLDSLEQFDSDSVSIWVYPEGPSADAGEDQHCNEGDIVFLDGTGSTGTEIIYAWEQTGGRDVALAQAASAQPSFEAPSAGGAMSALTFELTVTDAGAKTDTAAVIVNVFPVDVAVEITPYGDPLGIRVSHGSTLSRYIISTPDTYTQTVGAQGEEPVDLPHGLADISIESDFPITATEVYSTTTTFYLPTAALPDYGWAKLSFKGGWIDFSDHVVFNPDRTVVTMTLTDGGPGDDNAAAGIIDDPSGLALMAAGDDDNDSDSGGGGGGSSGCFIMTCWPR